MSAELISARVDAAGIEVRHEFALAYILAAAVIYKTNAGHRK